MAYMILKKTSALLVGAILYVPLGFIPVLGPLISGFAAGWISKGSVRDGFVLGSTSAFLGFLATLMALDFSGGGVLIAWVFTLWNLIGFFFAGSGGALGSLMAGSVGFRSSWMRREPGSSETSSDVYVICPACGHANPEKNGFCSSCKTKLMG